MAGKNAANFKSSSPVKDTGLSTPAKGVYYKSWFKAYTETSRSI